MRIRVSKIEVYQNPSAVYVRVWENLVPMMSNSEKNNMCRYLSDLEKKTASMASYYIQSGAYSQGKTAAQELADVIARYQEVLGCPGAKHVEPEEYRETEGYAGVG